jgi:hypothetical protein
MTGLSVSHNFPYATHSPIIQLFVDQKMVVEYNKGLPADMMFNALSFEMANRDRETDKYYISNIKVTKD